MIRKVFKIREISGFNGNCKKGDVIFYHFKIGFDIPYNLRTKPWNYISLASVLFGFEKNTFKHSFRFFNHHLAVNKKLIKFG